MCPLFCACTVHYTYLYTQCICLHVFNISMCSLQGDAVVSTQQQPSIDNGTPRVKVPSYKDYIDVWTQLMDPGKLQVHVIIDTCTLCLEHLNLLCSIKGLEHNYCTCTCCLHK